MTRFLVATPPHRAPHPCETRRQRQRPLMGGSGMTAAIANRPPTEAEIRAFIEEHGKASQLNDAITRLVAMGDEVWSDLRPSEEERLHELFDRVRELADKFEAEVVQATVRAAMQFAAEYPEAKRVEA